MRVAAKVLDRIGRCLFVFGIIIGLCWWLIPDEALDIEAEKITRSVIFPPAANNGYFMVRGFPAAPELDAHAVGQQIVAAHDRIFLADKGLGNFDLESFYGERPLAPPKTSKRLCEYQKESCLSVYHAKWVEIEAQSKVHAVYLARYRGIRHYPEFTLAISMVNAETPEPQWRSIMQMADLVDGSVAERMKSRNTQQAALEELAAEITLWRRISQGDVGLITQMIALNTLGRKYSLLSEILNKQPNVSAAYPVLLAEITAPLSPTESNIALSLGTEARWIFGAYRNVGEKTGSSDNQSFEDAMKTLLKAALIAGVRRANATLNELSRHFDSMIQFSKQSPKAIFDGHKEQLAKLEKNIRFSPFDIFYNPLGRYLNSGLQEGYIEYAFRVNDLIGYSRLIDLQRRIIAAGIEPEQIPAFLAAAGPGLMNPHTEQPMQWDAATQQVSFVGQSKRREEFGSVKVVPRK